MHKFLKGLSRAFRCPAQSSTRNTTTTSSQQDSVDDGVQPTPASRYLDCVHFLKSLILAHGSAVASWRWPRYSDGGKPLPPALPTTAAGVRRIESLKSIVLLNESLPHVNRLVHSGTDDGSFAAESRSAAEAQSWHRRQLVKMAQQLLFGGPSASALRSVLAENAAIARQLFTPVKNDVDGTMCGRVSIPVGTPCLDNGILPALPLRVRDAAVAIQRDAVFCVDPQKASSEGSHKSAFIEHQDCKRKETDKGINSAEASLDAAAKQLLAMVESVVPVGSAASSEGTPRHVRGTSPAALDTCMSDKASQTDLLRDPNLAASFNLGLCFEHGWGVSANKEKAAECYQKASVGGHLAASYNLALLYHSGALPAHKAGQCAKAEARRLIEQAAAGGLAEAQTWLGASAFEEGCFETAAKLFKEAAKQNNASGQYYLGMCYENGLGIDRSVTAAAAMYQKAAAGGLPDAQLSLDILCQDGFSGLPKDSAPAVETLGPPDCAQQEPVRGQGQSSLSSLRRRRRSSTGKVDRLDVLKEPSHKIHASASMPAFTLRINQLAADARQSGVRARSDTIKACLPLDVRGTRMSSASETDGAATPLSGCSDEKLSDPRFYLGDDEEGTSEDGFSDSDFGESSGGSCLLSLDDYPADMFGESLSNPGFGSSLVISK